MATILRFPKVPLGSVRLDRAEAGMGKVQPLRRGPSAGDPAAWAQLLRADSLQSFYQAWIAIQSAQIEHVLSGLLLVRSSGGASFEAAARYPAGGVPGPQLTSAAERALQERRGGLVELEPSTPGGDSHSLVVELIEFDGDILGVAIFELTLRPREEYEAALHQLTWGCAWLRLRAREREPASSGLLASLFEIIATPLEHESFGASASSFVTELATRFDCDRVSLGFEKRGRIVLSSVSHSALFSERANLTRALEAAMDEAFDQQAIVVWPASGHSLVTRAHEELARESDARAICSVPVVYGESFVGVVSFERGQDAPFDDAELELIDTAVAIAGPVLELQRREERWLPAKAADSLRAAAVKLVGPRHVALKLTAVLLVALLLFMALAKGDFRVSADAMIEAEELRAAVAPFDGYVADAPVRAGDRVAEGDLLVTLDERDLSLERARWASQFDQLQKEYRQLMAERDAAQLRILTAEMDQARARLGLAEQQLAKTRLVAPFDGVVVTGDLSQQLGAPVQRGDLLFEVAPLSGYRLVLDVDERDIDEIAVGQTGSFVFSSFPDQSFTFEVEKITPVSDAKEGANTFRVEAQLDASLEGMLPGMKGVAKVDVDRRRLLWIWTHDVVDWLRVKLWKWMP